MGRNETRFSNTSNDRYAHGNCKKDSGLTVINDAYNASPTAMEAAFHLMNGLDGFSQKIVVLGDMLELGDQEVQFHYEVGKLIDPAKISYVFTYGRLGSSNC